MKRTARAYRWSNERGLMVPMGTITCEVTGEWAGRIKCWTEIGKPCGNQYSLAFLRNLRRYVFVLEAET